MQIEVRTIKQNDYEKVHVFQCEYLDKEDYLDFLKRIKKNPDLYLVAVDNKELVGVCYGNPSEKVEFAMILQGIAVNLDEAKGYARVGIGSTMMRAFETRVKTRGYKVISVGSADDQKVEAFYLKNGFTPMELVVKSLHFELERIPIDDYENGTAWKEDLRRKYNPKEVIFIFEKYVE